MLGARLGLRIRRSNKLYWSAVVAIAMAAAVAAGSIDQGGDPATTEVLVATGDLSADRRIGPGDVELVERAMRDLPADTLTSLPAGAAARHPIAAGEPLLERRLTSATPSRDALALPHDGSLDIAVGDHLDLIATDDTLIGSSTVVAERLPVLAVSAEAVTVGVDREDALGIATARSGSWLTFVRVGS